MSAPRSTTQTSKGKFKKSRRKASRAQIPIYGWLGIAGALILVFFGLTRLLRLSETAQPDSQQTGEKSGAYSLMDGLIAQTRHFKGSPDAPVTILEFSDFQWRYCRQYATGAGRQIEEAYIKSGQVRFGYLHFVILGQESQWAAEASECAAEQDAFWEYHDILFENQAKKNTGGFSLENLKRFARDMGLDGASFDDCLASGRYRAAIEQETAIAAQIGFRGTPSFLANGQALVGDQPFEAFQEIIEAELAKLTGE